MGYVPGFEIDVFISYAHADDIQDVGEQRKWVEGFTDDLRKRLERKLKGESALDLWNDQKLERNRDLRTELTAKLEKSAVLMVILSQKYLDSPWCTFERHTFFNQLVHRSRSEAKSTVFLIKTDSIDKNDLPSEFTHVGYDFWIEYKQKDIVRRLHLHGDETEKRKYIDEFDRMSNQLIKELEKMRSEREIKEKPHSTIMANGPLHSTIFIAKVGKSGNLPELRENILARFADEDIKSIPQTFDQYPENPVEFEIKMRQDLEQCEMFIQLLDIDVGEKGIALPVGWPGLQYKIAQDMQIEMLQWYDAQNPHIRDIENEKYSKFLFECQQNGALKIMSINDFENSVIRKLKPPISIQPPKTKKLAKKVTVMIERKDCETIGKPLLDVLWARDDLSAEIIEPSDDPLELERTKKQEVRNSDGVIIVYGDICPTWVKGQITVCEKERTRDPLDHRLAICVAPPPPPPEPAPEPSEKLKQVKKKLAQMKVLNWQCGFNKDELNEYLDNI